MLVPHSYRTISLSLSPPCEDTCISTEISIGQNDKTGFERSRWINNAF